MSDNWGQAEPFVDRKRGGVHAPTGGLARGDARAPMCGAPWNFFVWVTRKRSDVTCAKCVALLNDQPGGPMLSFELRHAHICCVCRQGWDHQKAQDTLTTASIFGAGRYVVCVCCHQQVPEGDREDVNYQRRWRRWYAKHPPRSTNPTNQSANKEKTP